MARLARGAKCGWRGASGFTAAVAVPAAKRLSFSSDASASEPMPVAARPKNWRRVTARRRSWLNSGRKEIMVTSRIDRLQFQVRDQITCGSLRRRPNHHLPLPKRLRKEGKVHVSRHNYNDRLAESRRCTQLKKEIGSVCCFRCH